jgi:queuine tRNA-ribosyltransferase
MKEDINPILSWETPTIYICVQTEILEKAGGLHKFMNWDRNILTDSGGYQVYSFGKQKKSRKRVKFKSHIDGSFTFLHQRM